MVQELIVFIGQQIALVGLEMMEETEYYVLMLLYLVMKDIKIMVKENVLLKILLVQRDIKMMVEILKTVLQIMQLVL